MTWYTPAKSVSSDSACLGRVSHHFKAVGLLVLVVHLNMPYDHDDPFHLASSWFSSASSESQASCEVTGFQSFRQDYVETVLVRTMRFSGP